MGWDDYIPNSDAYDWDLFTIANGTTDYDLKANRSSLWKNLQTAKGIVIITDQIVGIKLNSTTMPRIIVSTIQSPWEFLNRKLIKNAFITNTSGFVMNIEVLLL